VRQLLGVDLASMHPIRDEILPPVSRAYVPLSACLLFANRGASSIGQAIKHGGLVALEWDLAIKLTKENHSERLMLVDALRHPFLLGAAASSAS
jgi:hypothetical protein